MRLLTLNFLCCPATNCQSRLDLKLSQISDENHIGLQEKPQEFSAPLMRSLINKLEWPDMTAMAKSVGIDLPMSYNPSDLENEDFLRMCHDALLVKHVISGKLVCAKCEKTFHISNGIANLMPMLTVPPSQ